MEEGLNGKQGSPQGQEGTLDTQGQAAAQQQDNTQQAQNEGTASAAL